jgi:hypothetical protein
MITASRREQSAPEQIPSFVSAIFVTGITAVVQGRAAVLGPQLESKKTTRARDPKTIGGMLRVRAIFFTPSFLSDWDGIGGIVRKKLFFPFDNSISRREPA